MMDEATYQFGLAELRRNWGGVHVDPSNMPGVIRATNDPLTGVLIGMRAPLFAEIINRALGAAPDDAKATALDALEPFAKAASQIRDDEEGDEWMKVRHTVADYREARDAFVGLGGVLG
jgi:hypothetical protein